MALRRLDPQQLDPTELDHWLHGARAVSALGHPSVAPVSEAVDAAGLSERPYPVFESVQGPTRAQALRGRGPWPAREAVTLAAARLLRDAMTQVFAAGLR